MFRRWLLALDMGCTGYPAGWIYCKFHGKMTTRGLIPREDWLAGVLYLGEIELFPGCDTPGIFRKIRITRRNLNQNKKKYSILTPWSLVVAVAQVDSIDGKNWGSKILLDCSFKKNSNFRENKAFQIDVIMNLCPWKNSLAGSLIFNAAELILRKSSAWIVRCKNNFCLPIF